MKTMSSRQIDRTARAVASCQLDSGTIPHFPGAHADPWNHIEAAMGLDVAGLHQPAERAYRWLAETQRSDGAWASAYVDGRVTDSTLDANFCAYIAVGTWHHYLATDDADFLDRMWVTVDDAIEFVLALQTTDGGILWARDPSYDVWPHPLLTSSACIYLSLRCAIAIAETIGDERPDWELSADAVAKAVAEEKTFQPKDRFSMDWYYPILAGIVTGEEAHRRLASRWDEFVIEGRGCRCVSDRPWVTTGETAELALALDVAGMTGEAEAMFDWVHHLRDDDDHYWIGATWPDGTVWPREKPTWGSGAVLLAADALSRSTPTSGLFRGETLPYGREVAERITDPL